MQNKNSSTGITHQQEYALIKKDLYRVLILNAIYLVGLVALYYADRRTQFLEHFFSKLIKF